MNAATGCQADKEAGIADRNAGAASREMLLVYQMQKVASVSWMAIGRDHFENTERIHVHYMAVQHLQYFHTQLLASGPCQTIQRPLLFRNLVRNGERSRAAVDDAVQGGRPLIIITGMRDPIARSASLLFFFADFYGRRESRLSWRDAADADDMRHAFLEIWEQVFDAAEPADTFGRVLRFYFGAYRIWFDREFRAVAGIDIADAAFPSGPARRLIEKGQTRVLIYRTEDMAPGTPGYALLHADIEALSGKQVFGFPVQNAAMFRKSRDLYRAFLRDVRVPERLLDRIYDDAAVRYFYTAEEVDAFRRRWRDGLVG